MGQVEYDAFKGWKRMFHAADGVNTNAPMVLTLHAALNREMDIWLAKQVKYPAKLTGLGFGQKISVLAATWKGDPDQGEKLRVALHQFNEVRNSVAHGDHAKQLKGQMEALRAAHQEIGERHEDTDEMVNIAADIIAFYGDDAPTYAEFQKIEAAMEEVGQKMAQLGGGPAPE